MLKKFKWIWICIIIILFSFIMLCLNYSKEEIITELATITPWNELSTNLKFAIIEYNNNNYNTYYINAEKSILSNDVIDKLLSEKEVKTYEEDWIEYNLIEHKSNCKIYSLKKVDENFIVAIQFDKESNYYLYVNYNYKVDTLEDFLESLDFIDNLNINSITYNYENKKNGKDKSKKLSTKSISKIDKNELYDYIFYKNFNLPMEDSQKLHFYTNYEVIIECYLSNLNIEADIHMTDEGYLVFYPCGLKFAFYMGEENVLDVIDYLFN